MTDEHLYHSALFPLVNEPADLLGDSENRRAVQRSQSFRILIRDLHRSRDERV